MGPATLARKTAQILWRCTPPSMRSRLFPYLLHDVSAIDKLRFGLPTMEGLLLNVRANGFAPCGIVDVGAYVGNWSRMAASVFPDASVLMVDGNPRMDEPLRRAQAELGARSSYAIRVLGPEARNDVTYYSADSGSGVLLELTTFEKGQLTLPMGTLDGLIEERQALAPNSSPLLMKVDVQGFELEILRGAQSTLRRAGFVILETSLIPYNEGSAMFGDVMSFMATAGFVVYDFCGQFRRESDNALFQTDVAFVRPDSDLRRPRKFWRTEP